MLFKYYTLITYNLYDDKTDRRREACDASSGSKIGTTCRVPQDRAKHTAEAAAAAAAAAGEAYSGHLVRAISMLKEHLDSLYVIFITHRGFSVSFPNWVDRDHP